MPSEFSFGLTSPLLSSSLLSSINAIPIANEGGIITSEYHNSLRKALLSLIELLGGSVSMETITYSFTPAFLDKTGDPPWSLDAGIASKPVPAAGTNLSSATGWLPIQLADDMHIQSLVAFGRRTGNISFFRVTLLRVALSDPDQSPTTLVSLNLKDSPDPFQVSGPIQVAGASATVLEDYKRVDNRNYKYFITARLLNADQAATVQLSAIQLVCSRA